MKCFIIDDDPSVRMMIRDILEEHYLEVVGCAEHGYAVNGELLVRKEVNLVLIDLIMPKKDGLETIRQLREEGYLGPAILLSKIHSQLIVNKAFKLGIDYFIQKPINRFELLSVLVKLKQKTKPEAKLMFEYGQNDLNKKLYFHYKRK